MMINNGIGEYVRNYRIKNKLSLRAFGELCSMSHTHIDSIEKGQDVRTGRPVNLTSQTVSKLASVMGLTESELINIACGEKTVVKITDAQLKYALFETEDVPDSLLDEVKKFAQYVKMRDSI